MTILPIRIGAMSPRLTHIIALGIVALLSVASASAEEVLRLYGGKAPGSETWAFEEIERASPSGGRIYQNVRDPELIIHNASNAGPPRPAVILLPGGGLQGLGVGKESQDMVERLTSEGMAVFTLKYRTRQTPPVPAGGAPRAPFMAGGPPSYPKLEFRNGNANPAPDDAVLSEVLDFAVKDATRALEIVRANAALWRIDPERVGMVGSSAGGGVALGALMRGAGKGPDFIGTLYGPSLMDVEIDKAAPPLFIATEADHQPVTDGLLVLYRMWKEAGAAAELHVYDIGASGMPAPIWLDRFVDWLGEKAILENGNRNARSR